MAAATVQLNTRIPEPVQRQLAALARRQGTTITHEVNLALRLHLDAARQTKGKT